MRVLCSWAKSRKISESIETMAPATLDGFLQKFYLEVRKQGGSEYELACEPQTYFRSSLLSLRNNACEPERQNDFHDVKPFVLVLANQIKG